jgi:hypothetical protein
MNATIRSRVERIITGVLRQAFDDAGTSDFHMTGDHPATAYATRLCERAGGRSSDGGLAISPTSKTEILLLADRHAADALPFGDLYITQLHQLAGPFSFSPALAELAALCGGPETLDAVLRLHVDGRRSWSAAAAGLPAPCAHTLKQRLDAARFRRMRIGLVPKLSARTPGIDLNA